MKNYASNDIRNIGIAGHRSAGKTSFLEAALFAAGQSGRLGKTAEGTSVMDFEPEDKNLKMTTGSHVAAVEWNGKKLNFVDTPGDIDLIEDARFALRGVDNVLLVVSAKDGVEAVTELGLDWAQQFGHRRAFFLSKMDIDNVKFDEAFDSLKRACPEATALQLPIGSGEGFKGVVDLLSLQAYEFADGEKGEAKKIDLPAALKDAAEHARNQLVEDVAAADEALMEKFFEDALTEDEIKAGLAKAVEAGAVVPVFVGAGASNRGVGMVLDTLSVIFTGPNRVFEAEDGSKLEPQPDGPLTAMVIKTFDDTHAGAVSIMRVISGTAKAHADVKHANKDIRLGAVNHVFGAKLDAGDSFVPGDIFAVTKLDGVHTGDTLSAAGFTLPALDRHPPQIWRAVHTDADEAKLARALERQAGEDPGLVLSRDEDTGESILSGHGQRELEIAVEKIKRKFGLDVTLSVPRIPYRETFSVPVKGVEGKHKKQSGGHGQFGVCFMDVEPGERGSGLVFDNQVVGGAIPTQFIPSVEKGLHKAMSRGVLAGYPLVDIRVRVYDGKYHAVDSSDMAFQMAASKGLKSAVAKAKPVLLEPIYDVSVTAPEEFLGDIMGDVSQRRGRIQGSESQGNLASIRGQIPLAELGNYGSALKAMTQGRGSFTMSLSHLEQVPPKTQEEVVKASGFKDEDED